MVVVPIFLKIKKIRRAFFNSQRWVKCISHPLKERCLLPGWKKRVSSSPLPVVHLIFIRFLMRAAFSVRTVSENCSKLPLPLIEFYKFEVLSAAGISQVHSRAVSMFMRTREFARITTGSTGWTAVNSTPCPENINLKKKK